MLRDRFVVVTLRFLLKGHTYLPNDRGFGNLGNTNKGNFTLTNMDEIGKMLNQPSNCNASPMDQSEFRDIEAMLQRYAAKWGHHFAIV